MHFTVEAQKIVREQLVPGDCAVDATAGNGHDTLFLADAVGPTGTVYAVDIQSSAIDRLRDTLARQRLLDRVELNAQDHALLKQLVAPKWHGRIACAMFNLGYLPHSDKSIATRRESTLSGIDVAFSLLKPSGVMTVLAYVGHEGGQNEAEGVAAWIASRASDLDCSRIQDATNPASPILWVIRKR